MRRSPHSKPRVRDHWEPSRDDLRAPVPPVSMVPLVSADRTRAIFRAERARFAVHYPHVSDASLDLVLSARIRPGAAPRDLAECYPGDLRVRLARGGRTSEARVRGLVRHELGHLALRGGGSEQDADDVAEEVTGQRIRYDADDVQTTGRGRWPRPRHLPR